MSQPIRYLLKHGTVLLALIALISGALGVHVHAHAEKSLFSDHQHHFAQTHHFVDGAHGDDVGNEPEGDLDDIHVHAHGCACTCALPDQAISIPVALTQPACYFSLKQLLPKLVHFEVDTPPDISAV